MTYRSCNKQGFRLVKKKKQKLTKQIKTEHPEIKVQLQHGSYVSLVMHTQWGMHQNALISLFVPSYNI